MFLRLIQTLLSLWLLVSLTFVLLRFFPGSPFDDEISLHPVVQQQVSESYGLHLPVLKQYQIYLSGLLQGNLGVSQFFAEKSVLGVLRIALPTTIALNIFSLIFSCIVALALALAAQIFLRFRFFFEMLTLALLSIPTLLAGPALILFFGFWLDWLPVALLENSSAYILPVLVLSMRPIASLSRILNRSLSENSGKDDLRTFLSLGISPIKILLKYNLRAALIPAFSYLGGLAGTMMGGSVMVEVVFALPGLGSQFIEAVMNRDTSMVLGLTLSYGFFILFFQFIVDLLLPVIDPRLRSGSVS